MGVTMVMSPHYDFPADLAM